MANYLIYGAYGYTGELIARLAVDKGQRPILAGRNPQRLAALADELDLEDRVFQLHDPHIVEARLEGVAAVLHCAGPFARTFRPMSEACLKRGVHYVDITGEVEVFERLAARDAEAREAGVMLLPGAGFDVVPTDCLAVHLKRRLPAASQLCLGVQGLGGVSRGTALTMVESLHRGGLVRRDGRLVNVPAAWKKRQVDFGEGPVSAVTIPWGDLTTAFWSTGIPNLEVYMALPAGRRFLLLASRVLGPLLGSPPVQAFLKSRVRRSRPGPTEEERRRGRGRLWGEATDEGGNRVTSRLLTPEGYTLTAHTAVALMERILAADAPPGFQTPAKAYGADFVLAVDGVERHDEG